MVPFYLEIWNVEVGDSAIVSMLTYYFNGESENVGNFIIVRFLYDMWLFGF